MSADHAQSRELTQTPWYRVAKKIKNKKRGEKGLPVSSISRVPRRIGAYSYCSRESGWPRGSRHLGPMTSRRGWDNLRGDPDPGRGRGRSSSRVTSMRHGGNMPSISGVGIFHLSLARVRRDGPKEEEEEIATELPLLLPLPGNGPGTGTQRFLLLAGQPLCPRLLAGFFLPPYKKNPGGDPSHAHVPWLGSSLQTSEANRRPACSRGRLQESSSI